MVRKNQNKNNRNRRNNGAGVRNRASTTRNSLAPAVAKSSFGVHAPEHACGYLDPFCPSLGKVPDGSQVASMPTFLRRAYTVTTDANGDGAIGFITSRLKDRVYNATAWTAGAVSTWTASDHADYSAVAAFSEQFRVVSQGYRVSCIANATAMQGIKSIGVGPLTAGNFAGTSTKWDDPMTLNEWTGIPEQRVVQLFPFEVSARNYEPFAHTNTHDWPVFVVYVNGGAASTAILLVEEFIKVELAIDSKNILSRSASDSAPRNSALLNAQSKIPQSARGARFMDHVEAAEHTAMRLLGMAGKAKQIYKAGRAVLGAAETGGQLALEAAPYIVELAL